VFTSQKKLALRRAVKLALLFVFRLLGGFVICRLITSNKVRILCYHGISIGDQHIFEPILFMREATFARRMEFLHRKGWRTVSLSDSIAMLESGDIRECPVVVTIDDGWKSTTTHAVPVLARLGIPATLYLTTYYAERGADVFNIALLYLFWKSGRVAADLRFGDETVDGVYDLRDDRRKVALRWIEYAEHHLDWRGRQRFLEAAAVALGLDPRDALAGERFRIMDRVDVARAVDQGIDVELHTHRHRMPGASQREMQREIDDNRRILEEWVGKHCTHFCYPSGLYEPQHPGWLAAAGLRSATTCDPGLCGSDANLLLLPRILDREGWTMLEFEAALSGLGTLLGRSVAASEHAL
jgi:peptidoglycan/xylan/chitin deacetylase (PgdA/CDA1 family)